MRKSDFAKEGIIRYDQCQQKQSVLCSIVFFVLIVFSCVILYGDYSDTFSDWSMMVLFFVNMCSGPAFIYSVYQLFASVCYIKQLEKQGYEIPKDKKDYNGLLENLPHQDVSVQKEAYSKTSLALGIVSVVAFGITIVFNVQYIFDWLCVYQEEIVAMILIQSVFDCVLLVRCVSFFRQMNTNKYKDVVEIDGKRKNRKSLVDGIFVIVVLLVLSLFSKRMVGSMTDYLFKSKVEKSVTDIQHVQKVLSSVYIDRKTKDFDMAGNVSVQDMVKGVDITTWGTPKDSFQQEVAEMLGIEDFSELKDDFYVADGDAVVYVKLVDGEICVQILNVYEKWKVKLERKNIIEPMLGIY